MAANPEYDRFEQEAAASIQRQLAATERQQEQAARLLAGAPARKTTRSRRQRRPRACLPFSNSSRRSTSDKSDRR